MSSQNISKTDTYEDKNHVYNSEGAYNEVPVQYSNDEVLSEINIDFDNIVMAEHNLNKFTLFRNNEHLSTASKGEVK